MKLTEDNFYKSYDDITNTDILVIESVYDRDQVEKQILENQRFCEIIQEYFKDKVIGNLSPKIIIKHIESNQRLRELMEKRHKQLIQWLKDNKKHDANLHDLYKINWTEEATFQSLLDKAKGKKK